MLIDRGDGLIYDITRNITWLADLNYAQASGHTGTGVNANGGMGLNLLSAATGAVLRVRPKTMAVIRH